MTPEEKTAVDERVRNAFIMGQYVMRDKIQSMIGRLEKWGSGYPGSIPIEGIRPQEQFVLDEDTKTRLIELLRSSEL
jgi:hypothetical protein